MRNAMLAATIAFFLVGCTTPDNQYKSQTGLDESDPKPMLLDVSSIASSVDPADHTTLNRVLLITLSPQVYSLSDRLVFVRLKIIPADDYLFSGLTATATQWGSQTIDNLSLTSQAESAPELDAPLAIGTLKTPLALSRSSNVTATNSVAYEKLSANIRSDGSILLTGTGARGIDLTGTSLVKLKLIPSETSNLVTYGAITSFKVATPHGEWLKPDQTSATFAQIRTLRPVTYTASADLTYTIRHVKPTAGLRTYSEADDDVAFITVTEHCSGLVLATKLETGLASWSIFHDHAHVALATAEGQDQLHFTDYEDALQFAAWLGQVAPKTIGGNKLVLQSRDDSSQGRAIVKGIYDVRPVSGTSLPQPATPAFCEAYDAQGRKIAAIS